MLPPIHRLAGCESLRFAEIADENHIGLSAGSALQDYLAHQAARLGKALTVRVRLKGFDGVCRMAERGVGVAVIPETAAQASGVAATILPLSDVWADRTLALCVRDPSSLPPVARRLFDHLLSQARVPD